MAGLAALWHRLPENFTEQLDLLQGRVSEYHFDDGYEDIVRAGDILEARGLTGVFYVVPAWLGLDGQATKADVLELHMRGHEIGNHTMHHVWMPKVPVPVQVAEWQAAQIALEDITGATPDRFAWPYGQVGNASLGTKPRGIQKDEVVAPRDRYGFELQRLVRFL